MSPSDAELIARVIQSDDRHAFEQLVRRYQSQVRGLLRRLNRGNNAIADDLAQDTFMRAYQGIPNYRGGSKFSSWLYRIAYNVSMSNNRKSKVQGSDVVEDAAPTADSGTKISFRHDLTRAMVWLSTGEQAAIALAYGAEATHEEIAEALECPIGTAKTHILRAKEKLRRRLCVWEHRELI